jgi:hypothetical protein
MAGGKLLTQANIIRRLCQQLPAAPFDRREIPWTMPRTLKQKRWKFQTLVKSMT